MTTPALGKTQRCVMNVMERVIGPVKGVWALGSSDVTADHGGEDHFSI